MAERKLKLKEMEKAFQIIMEHYRYRENEKVREMKRYGHTSETTGIKKERVLIGIIKSRLYLKRVKLFYISH